MKGQFKHHPIQLVDLKVLELFIKSEHHVEKDDLPEEGEFAFYHAHSPLNESNNTIAVKMGVKIDEGDDAPFELKVELLGIFEVNLEKFSIEHIESWAKGNAPLILYPYIREQVYSLAIRAGIDGILLPLFEVPSFKYSKES